MNCMSIECGEHRLLVDCGVTFPDLPFGTDVIRPDFRYLREAKRKHQALWLTHGHEDHIATEVTALGLTAVELAASAEDSTRRPARVATRSTSGSSSARWPFSASTAAARSSRR